MRRSRTSRASGTTQVARSWLPRAGLAACLSGVLMLAAMTSWASAASGARSNAAGTYAAGTKAAGTKAAGAKAAATPPMGFNSWNAYACDSSAQTLESVARFMHGSGLEQDGYKYVNQDGCYADLEGIDSPNTFGVTAPVSQDPETCGVINGRLPDGQLYVNSYLYPPSRPCANNGVKLVANYVHALGLRLGAYLDASNNWNCEEIPGTYGFDATDAKTLASWGVDYVKADWGCSDTTVPPASNAPAGYKGIDAPPGGTFGFGGPTFSTNPAYLTDQQDTQQKMYAALGKALAKVHRHILLSVAGGGTDNPVDWGFEYGGMVRPTPDSNANFTEDPSNRHYGGSLVGIVNAEAQTYEQYTGPGHWIDPDMMEAGNFSADGDVSALTASESEMSMFSELSDPLLMSTNLCPSNCGPDVQPAARAQLRQAVEVFGNRRVIAVDQDKAANPAQIVGTFDGTDLIMSKKLSDGQFAVTLFNESTTNPATVSTTASAAGLPAASNYELQNLWTGDVTSSSGVISATVAPGQTVMYRIAAGAEAPWQPTAASNADPAKVMERTIPAAPVAVSAKTPNNLVGIACPSTRSCVAASAFGGVATLNPAKPGTLKFTSVDSGRQLTGISCPSASECVALDLAGHAVRFNPSDLRQSVRIAPADRGREPTAIDCVSPRSCVIVDGSGYEVVYDPHTGRDSHRYQVDPWIYLGSVSCPSATQCTAVGGGGNGGPSQVTFNPVSGQVTAGGIASLDDVTVNGDVSVSCPTSSQCTAVDGSGDEVTFDPVAEAANAAGTAPLEGDSLAAGLGVFTSVDCSSSTQCTAVDLSGNEVTFNPQTATANSGGVAAIDPGGNGLESVACISDGSSCTTVDLDGRALTFSAASGKISETRKTKD
jgi:alpha-galactosidase